MNNHITTELRLFEDLVKDLLIVAEFTITTDYDAGTNDSQPYYHSRITYINILEASDADGQDLDINEAFLVEWIPEVRAELERLYI